ncbi:hypothetical protein CYY_002893 [Polysphondylium violaceum]|uniref:FNIP repeat-containing protein n=1 Tax=Polysphondylium violaceum TaxID=133409 RepID=A0A8J4V0K0_9MYCE|nr:hypothetical protein CYY_002893 [Polysphondylium violaceum]
MIGFLLRDILFFQIWRDKYLYKTIISFNDYDLISNAFEKRHAEQRVDRYKEFNSAKIRFKLNQEGDENVKLDDIKIKNLVIEGDNDRYLKVDGKMVPESVRFLSILPFQDCSIEIKSLDTLVFVTHLTFGYFFNGVVSKSMLPPLLTHLSFGASFNQYIGEDILPKSLTHLSFGSAFDRFISPNTLPPHLRYLSFGSKFKQSLAHVPQSLTHLVVGLSFVWEKGFEFPQSLLYIEFGKGLNMEGSLSGFKLPPKLVSLSIGPWMNTSIPMGFIPSSLRFLKVGACATRFDLEKDSLPASLTSIEFAKDFKLHIDQDIIPPSVTNVKWGLKYSQPLTVGMFPLSLIKLSFGYDNVSLPIPKGFIPDSVTSLELHLNSTNQQHLGEIIPSGVTYLSLSTTYPIPVGTIPNSTKYLVLDNNHPLVPGLIPDSVTHLTLGPSYNQPIQANSLPSSLKSLSFGLFFNQELTNLPSSVVSLSFGESFNRSIDTLSTLTPNLKSLKMGLKFNQPINSLSPKLKQLRLNKTSFNSLISSFPSSLEHLSLPPLYSLNLPPYPSLTTLEYREYRMKNHPYPSTIERLKLI